MTVDSVELVVETPYIWRARRPDARHRLICFPHAGAGAGAYAEWADLLPPEIELVAVQLPGRQNRIMEDPFTETGPLVRVLAQALRPVLDGSYAFFGHSCGAVMAYELTRVLRGRGAAGPDHLFFSAQPAPRLFDQVPRLHDLTDDEFREQVAELGGLDPEIAEDEDVMDALLPTLRADFEMWEQHPVADGEPLDIPITVLSGREDPRAPGTTVEGWREHTTGPFHAEYYPGGHFYFLDAAAEVVGFLGQSLLAPSMTGRVS
ncbi:alpha/beta fold hydrolase [Amycolatopsis sp. NPDC051071]|uniref:thioesterase II family protein n=1 Tax=Amycolatopsis sp. NPDC051071 TaxID=3154637 RepID=UPI003441E147